MKRYIFTALLMLTTLPFFAQQKPTFIGLNAGASIPTGGFRVKELPDGGFATTGFSASLEGAWFFTSWLGAGANAGISLHPVNAGALGEAQLKDNMFLEDLTIRSDPYRSISFYAGLYFQWPIVDKLSVTAKAMGGLLFARTPYQLYKAEYFMIGKNWYDITSAGDYEPSFLAGAGLRYDMNDFLGFAMNSEFTYNKCEFEFRGFDGNVVRTENKVVSFINIALGLIIRI